MCKHIKWNVFHFLGRSGLKSFNLFFQYQLFKQCWSNHPGPVIMAEIFPELFSETSSAKKKKKKKKNFNMNITTWSAKIDCLCLNKFQQCKTQNSGLHSKEEKPRDPINEPSRCNMQEGLLSVAQTGDSDLLGGKAPRTANWASFYGQKPHYQHITYGLQRDCLHVCKAILLVPTSQLWFKLRCPRAFQLSRGLLLGVY